MTKQLYEEALADVKKLKEVAEDNAKRALLEAVTPRIKDLIENQLLGEVEADEDKLLHDEELESEGLEDFSVNPVPGAGDSEASGAAISLPDEEGKVTLDLDALKVPGTDEFELGKESVEALGAMLGEGNLERLFQGRVKSAERQIRLLRGAGPLVRESKGYSEALDAIISEVEDMYSHLQTKLAGSAGKTRYESILENFYSTLKKLTEQKMTKKNKRLSEADVTLKLTGLPDDVDLDSVGVDLIAGEEGEEEGGEEEGGEELDLDLGEEGEEEGDEEEKEGQMESRRRRLGDNLVVEIDERMLRREISRMKALREAKDDVQSWGHGAGAVSDDFEDDDMGDPFVDIALREADGDDDDDDDSKKGMEEGQDDEDLARKDQVVEIDLDELDDENEGDDDLQDEGQEPPMDQSEKRRAHRADDDVMQPNVQPDMPVEGIRRRLATEARLQSKAKRKAQSAKKQQGKKQQEAQRKMKESQQQAKQGKKIQSQQNKKMAQKKMQEARRLNSAYGFYARRFNESVARCNRLRGMLNEASRRGRVQNGAPLRSAAESSNLRNKLAETNLFNAKLLFTNKLLQNESLTKRQKAEVIERLDEAKTEREVKLVYESLVKTLQGTSSRLTETVDRGVIGSSSRPVRPASTNTLAEGFEADRWARLAGIVK